MNQFIELTASFKSENQPDFANLGIDVDEQDMENSDWLPVLFNVGNIVTLNVNDAGYTNVNMVNGEKWSVKETPQEIRELCKS